MYTEYMCHICMYIYIIYTDTYLHMWISYPELSSWAKTGRCLKFDVKTIAATTTTTATTTIDAAATTTTTFEKVDTVTTIMIMIMLLLLQVLIGY